MPKVPFWIFIVLAVLYFSAARIDTMDVDASQYAEMSREMHLRGDYVHLYDRDKDYLDKPPFLFWVSSASIGLFGVSNVSYKLPSILFALWALYALYRLTRLLYNDATARMAALVLGTCQGMFLMTNDVRCDTILTAWVITAIWLIQEWQVKCRRYYFVGGCAAIAFGMMTKGPIALLVPIFCFAVDWALKRQWRNFFRPIYLLGIIVILLLLLPMSIGLYQQFDMHPEKMIDGKFGTSGLRFFYWSQSFGRITGESPWENGVDISFLYSNMLWSFLPWIFLFTAALVVNCIALVKQKFRLQPHQEWVSTGGFLLTYIALGSSRYQLPHYIFVAFPLAAIMVAKLLQQFFEEQQYRRLYNIMRKVHVVIMSILFFAALLMLTFVFQSGAIGICAWGACVLLWLYLLFNKQLKGKLFWLCASGIMMVNIFATNHFYAHLLPYQLGSQLGRYVKAHNIPPGQTMGYHMQDPINSLSFYAQQVIRNNDTLQRVYGKQYLVAMDNGIPELLKDGFTFDTITSGRCFKVSELTPEFLNPATRPKALKNYYLLKVKKSPWQATN